jgi:hypothetical protein
MSRLFANLLLEATLGIIGAILFSTIANAQITVDFSTTLNSECTFGTPVVGSLTPNTDSTVLQTTTGNEAEVSITCNVPALLAVFQDTTIEYVGNSNLFGSAPGDDPQLSGDFIPLDHVLTVLDRDDSNSAIIQVFWIDGNVTSFSPFAVLQPGTRTLAVNFILYFNSTSDLPPALRFFPEGTYTTTTTLSVSPN